MMALPLLTYRPRMPLAFLLLMLLAPAVAAAQTVPVVVAAPDAPPDAPRAELLRRAREARKDIVHSYRPSTLEKWLAKAEPFLMRSGPASGEFRRGFYPKIGSVTSGSGWAVGPGYRYEGLADGLVDINVFARASWKKYWQVEGRVEMPRLNDERTGIGAFARLRDMPQEDFFGIGPGSEFDDRVSFGLREFAAGGFMEHRFDALTLTGGLEHVSPSTRAGTDKNYPSIEQRFDVGTLPGFADHPDFFVLRAGAVFDRTDAPDNPRRGPQHRVEFSSWRSRGGTASNFNALNADLRQYIPFFNETRVIVVRAALWHTDPADGADVPLYYQPVLGGSHELRGYREFRFRDRTAFVAQAEYRFEILPGADGALFYEAGTVGPSIGDLERFKTDYGLGVRFGTRDGVFLRIEGAFGTPESPRFYVKLSNAF